MVLRAEAARCAKRAYQKAQRAKEGIYVDSSEDDYSTDEEYQKMIAGEESDGEGAMDGMDPVERQQLLDKFNEMDQDGSGTITIKEFMTLYKAQQQQGNFIGDIGGSDTNTTILSLSNRIKRLETAMESNSHKLDKILQMLESKKTR